MRRFICLFVLLSGMLAAQTTAGRIGGTVKDQSGAVVPNVKLAATDTETGREIVGRSNGQGQYALYPLPPGVYSLSAEASGFKNVRIENIRIEVAANLSQDLSLEVGSVAEGVTVSGIAPPMLPETHSIESTVTREQIETLPLNGRDFNQLVLLAPGAVDSNTGGNNDFGAVAMNGNRSYGNDYMLDGAPNNNVYQGRSAAPVSIDVIREFKVTSGVASAEFGQGGSQISLVTRGGTNQLHGNLFEYYRGTQLQARDTFNTSKPAPFVRNQFGGSVGGPVVRNRTFFFFNYEGNRQTQNVTRLDTVPLDAFWAGDFSSLLPRVQLRDPFTTGRPVIPNNRLDQYMGGARISKTALALKSYFASPTSPGLANNLLLFPEQATNADQFTIRGDQTLPHNTTLAARLTYSNTGGFTPNLLGTPGVGRTEPLDSRNGSVSITTAVSSRTVNELRLGAMNFSDIVTYSAGDKPTVDSLGLKGFEKGDTGIPLLPQIQFTGTDAFTPIKFGDTTSYGEAALSMVNNIYTLSDTVSHFRGKHSLKAGFEARRTMLNCLQQSNARGQLSFRGSSSASNSTGYSFADFLIGLPSSSQQIPVKSKVLLKQMEFSSYIQDDWRVTSRLTLSLGLRHELFLNPYEDRNRLAMFDINTGAIVVASDDGKLPTQEFNPLIVSKLTDGQGNWKFPLISDKAAGFNPRSLLDTNFNNWGPRFGFVYQPFARGRMVVRGGYGMFYSRYPRQYLLQTVAINPPFAGNFTYSTAITNGVSNVTLDAPYPTAGASASVSPAGLQKDFGLPSNQQWNFTVEREIGFGTVASLGYIGNKGTHLYRSINANGAYLDPLTGQAVRKYAGSYGTSTINFRKTDGNSVYNSMVFEVRRRAGKRLNFQANWTWAKGLDDVGQNVQTASLDLENLGRDRANSDYVRRHSFNFNATYELPFARHSRGWVRHAAAGWRLSDILHYTTGRYLTPTFTTTGGLSNNRPDVVYGVSPQLDAPSASLWFNPKAFAEVPATDPVTGKPRFGNAGRNTIVGPGLSVMDASLAKSFPVWKEGRAITFRLEAFNLLNHPNYGNPDLNISNVNTVGSINNVIRPMRQVQLALRFDF